MATDPFNFWPLPVKWSTMDEPWIPTTHKAHGWPDATIGRLFTTKGKVCLAMYHTKSSATAQVIAVEPLVVKFQGYVFYKHGINVTFIYHGQESELVFVPMEQVTGAGLLKAADDFLIGLDE